MWGGGYIDFEKHKNNSTARIRRSTNVIDLERTVIKNKNEIIDLETR